MLKKIALLGCALSLISACALAEASFLPSYDFSSPVYVWNNRPSIETEIPEFSLPETHQPSRVFSLAYPDIKMTDSDEKLKKQNLYLYDFQETEAYRVLPKDLVPYLGIRMNYSVTEKFGFFNDITPKNVFYGFQYHY